MEGQNIRSWGILLLLAFVWGSSFILMEKALHGEGGIDLLSPMQIAQFRLAISGITLIPFSIIALRKIEPKMLIWISMVGIFGNGIPAFLFPLAQTKLASGFAGMLNTLTPFFVFLIAVFIFGTRVKRRQIIGLFIGLAGAVGLIMVEKGVSGEFSIPHALYIVIATICYGISVSILHFKLKKANSLFVAALALLIVGLPSTISILIRGELQILNQGSDMVYAFGYVIILSVLGTALALILFNRLVQVTNSIFASTVTYIIPIFAALWGVYFGEQIGWLHILFGAVIIGGVYLVNKK